MDDTADMQATVTLQAMALNVPDTPGHPNKHPFKGVLTRIDEPSDNPPGGSGGKRVILPRDVAEKALPTLLGMPVDMKANLSDHDVKSKVGTITAATIEGNAIHIEGFLYAADFPEEVRHIQSRRDELGFSWEIQCRFDEDKEAGVLVITDCIFTGAAILFKNKAAYQTTSLAAKAEEIDMTKEILDAINALDTKVGTIQTSVNEQFDAVGKRIEKMEASQDATQKQIQAGKEHMAKVEPHAAGLEACAAAMEADGVGGHATRGHVKACRAMADNLRASAAVGKIADVWPGFDGFHASAETKAEVKDDTANAAKDKEISDLKDVVSGLNTKITDLQASATRSTQDPGRKTLSPQIMSLLSRGSITLPNGEGKVSLPEVNKMLAASSLSIEQRIELKNAMQRDGMIAA